MKLPLLLRLVVGLTIVVFSLSLCLWAFQEYYDEVYFNFLLSNQERSMTSRGVTFSSLDEESVESSNYNNHRTLIRVPMTKEVEREKAFMLYRLWKDISHMEESDEFINEEDETRKVLLVFIIPGHGQSYKEF